MVPVADLRRSADRANQALTTLRTALNKPTPEVAHATSIMAGVIADIEAGQHPLKHPDDWSQRDRWPQRPHWDCWAWAITTLAAEFGTQVQCAQKYEYLNIHMGVLKDSPTVLLDIADLIELASDYEDVDDTACRWLTHAEMDSLRAEIRRDGLWAKSQFKRLDLLRAVPVREMPGNLPYIVLADIPEQWRNQFAEALLGSAAPLLPDVGPCAYAHDWRAWVAGTWYGRPGPDFSVAI